MQGDLDEEQRARQREFKRAQGIGELALEQHQGLELAHWVGQNSFPSVQCCSANQAHSMLVSMQIHLWRSMAKDPTVGTQFQRYHFVAKKQTEVIFVCNTPDPFAYSPFHDCPAHVYASSHESPLINSPPPLPKHTHQALSFWAYILLSLCAPFISVGIQQGAPKQSPCGKVFFNRELCDYTPAS